MKTQPNSGTVHTDKMFPTAYINHGGGPLPLLGKQPLVVEALQSIAKAIPVPDAIVIISGHFEAPVTTLLTNPSPPLLYDYYGFPAKSYQLKYPAPSALSLLPQVRRLLSDAGIPFVEDTKRGYDHGVFVPLSIMYPDANIPVLAISQPASMSPADCIRLGKALKPLRSQRVLVLGSGASFHNFDAFFRVSEDEGREDVEKSEAWDNWLKETVCEFQGSKRNSRLEDWETAPFGRFAHPREEHLMPLFVAAGAAGDDRGICFERDTFRMFTLKVSQFVFGL